MIKKIIARIKKAYADATNGLACDLSHGQYHKLHQIEYGGGYVAECTKCGRSWMTRR